MSAIEAVLAHNAAVSRMAMVRVEMPRRVGGMMRCRVVGQITWEATGTQYESGISRAPCVCILHSHNSELVQ